MGSLERSADGWIHLFFSNHWQNNWLNDWEARWNTGFSVFSYPPLAHQLIAILAQPLGLVQGGLLAAISFTIILLWGIYRYSRIWFEQPVAWLAVVLGASSSSLAISLQVFGQLPNLLALGLILHSIPWLRKYVLSPQWPSLLTGTLLSLSAAQCNLYAAVFGLFFFGLPVWLESLKQPKAIKRWGIIIVCNLFLGLIVLAPHLYFQLYFKAFSVPVFHSSRHSILAFKPFNWYIFYGQYGLALLALPFWLYQTRNQKLYQLFLPSVILLGILSLGGSTPLAHWLTGPLFDSMTFDRFGQWNSLLLCPLIADMLLKIRSPHYQKAVLAVYTSIQLLAGLYSGTTTWWKPLPTMRPLEQSIAYFNQPAVKNYRYLTLGLGRANFARFSALVQAPSIDGNFPFGRNLKLLNHSGLAMIDDARYYQQQGWKTLYQVLQAAPLLHLKYILLADPVYKNLLLQTGWHFTHNLDGLELWSRAGIPSLNTQQEEAHPSPLCLRLIWACLPLLSLLGALLGIFWSRHSTQGFRLGEAEG